MKKIYFNITSIILLLIFGCSTDKNFTSQKYTRFNNNQAAIDITKPIGSKALKNSTTPYNPSVAADIETTTTEGSLSSSVYKNDFTVNNSENDILAKTISSKLSSKISNNSYTHENNVVTESRERKNKENKKPIETDKLLLILLAILLPPVAVYMVKGIGKEFWINILLCLCCIGGVIHALIVVLNSDGSSIGNGGGGSKQRRSEAN